MPVRILWLSSVPNFVAHFRSNLDDLTIISAFKCVSITALFILLGIIGGLFTPFLFIHTVTSFRFLYIPTRAVLVTVYFLVGLYAILGDVGVSLSAYLLHLNWVELFVWIIGSPLHWMTGHWSNSGLILCPYRTLDLCRHGLVRNLKLPRSFSCFPRVLGSCFRLRLQSIH